MSISAFFTLCQEHQSLAINPWVWLWTSVKCLFVMKWQNNLSSDVASKLCDTQMESTWRIQQPFGDIKWVSNKLWSSTIASKIVIYQWRVNNVLIGPQQANITVSLTKCRLRSCRTSKSLSKNLRTRWWINIGLVHSILSEDLNRLVGSWNLKAVAWQINRLFSSHLIQTLLAKYNILWLVKLLTLLTWLLTIFGCSQAENTTRKGPKLSHAKIFCKT